MTMHEAQLLTPEQMYEADRLTIAGGIPGTELMDNAGGAITHEILARWPSPGRAVVLCGPGNNGGDGFVIARQLSKHGWTCDVYLLGEPSKLKGDAKQAAGNWEGEVRPLAQLTLEGATLVVDALFGAGLSRGLDGVTAEAASKVADEGVPVVAVDIPSGVDGTTGLVATTAFQAELTVTFFRKKPGHLLYPGRTHCGETVVAQIGIEPLVLNQIAPQGAENEPSLWRNALPVLKEQGHKYHRGHTISVSGPAQNTGAARLAAMAALRAGSGLVTVASPPDALAANAAHLTAVMLREISSAKELAELFSDRRITSVIIGPALGLDDAARGKVLAALNAAPTAVLDADALSCFREQPRELFDAIASRPERPVVLTPHSGEFAGLFDVDTVSSAGKVAATIGAAQLSAAVVVLKGPDSVIAAPDGRYAINSNAPPTLATAGSGDVLAGIVAGLLAQGMSAFEAACAAVWLHGAAASVFGPGLIAEDLPHLLPIVLKELGGTR
ncbi:MAG: NAD(P)H-hydrate dehydratase [Rhizobiales bacterium]|nr:NAD(P)H-hydrate dehydratase [Hyphomicrobiales bacterium]